ncbi:hypothetical protein E2C01_026452 [Portunus trituberculatus]|uniref:Uncharacterized protein n=1 Tax=Portunus trituberculatus TaxID=210409 RepID=A0A5B7EFF8_PORTR|nr:hypothetical protein [Portunus trituberculatus]
MADFPTVSGGCVSSPILEAFVTKNSEVEAEFHQKISAPQRAETTISFTVLEGVVEEIKKAGGHEVRRADDFQPAGKILVVGDSQVRHLDSMFCAKDRKRRTRVCLPAAGIKRVSAQLDTYLANGIKPIVFLSTG